MRVEGSVLEFGSCIEFESKLAARRLKGELESKWKEWTDAPPKAQSMSHIREKSFSLSSGLEFLTRSAGSGAEDFEYLVQTTFGAGENFIPIRGHTPCYERRLPRR